MKELKTYFREIKHKFPGGCKKNKILRDLRLSVDDFLQENPDATLEAVVEHFGTPQQIADAYTEELPAHELQKQLKIKRWIIGIIAGAVACTLIMWGIAVGVALINEFKAADGYHEEEPIIVEESE